MTSDKLTVLLCANNRTSGNDGSGRGQVLSTRTVGCRLLITLGIELSVQRDGRLGVMQRRAIHRLGVRLFLFPVLYSVKNTSCTHPRRARSFSRHAFRILLINLCSPAMGPCTLPPTVENCGRFRKY